MVVSLTLNENSLIGGFLSGVILSSILFGILSVQAALYFQYFPNDKFWIRLMVAISWVIQGVQVFITAFVVYFRLIGDWAPDDVPDLIDLPWYSTIWQLVSVVAALGTQTCLVLRLHTLLGSRCLPVLTFATAVITFALGIWSVSVFIDGDISQIRTSYLSWLVSTTLVDTKLAFCMMFVIHRRKTGITSTDRALQTMMVYAITTGMLTAFVSLAIVIGNSVGNGEHSGIVALGIGFSQLHTMTLLSILHGRRKVKKHLYADN
ncbi:hypothetical protein DL93DRAFT_1791097 [Clavulina sp. PMI_390]|nr:hypothetical protein DL93DRAFT_1791097 [Clavulina sp. PMI_390]